MHEHNMQLNPNSSKALDQWLAAPTWYRSEYSDMEKFYNFVNQYQKESGYDIEEKNLEEEIASRAEVEGNDAMMPIIRERVSLAISILEFLKQTGR